MHLVTGASSGIGEAICEELKARGHSVYGVAQSSGPHVIDVMDLTNEMNVLALAGALRKEVQSIVNCAGVNALYPFELVTRPEAERVMAINVWAAVELVQAFYPYLRDEGKLGRVCNIVSSAADVPMTHSLIYNVSKAGMKMATRQMAHELRDITVFGVSPAKVSGTLMTDYIDKTVPGLRGWTEEEAKEYQRKALLAGEEVERFDLANFVAFLLTDGFTPSLTGCVMPYGV